MPKILAHDHIPQLPKGRSRNVRQFQILTPKPYVAKYATPLVFWVEGAFFASLGLFCYLCCRTSLCYSSVVMKARMQPVPVIMMGAAQRSDGRMFQLVQSPLAVLSRLGHTHPKPQKGLGLFQYVHEYI